MQPSTTSIWSHDSNETASGKPGTLQLLIKLIAFSVMLGLAGLNRFYLTPALSNSVKSGDAVTAGFAVRTSIGLELALATSALALMAWLGTLDPNA